MPAVALDADAQTDGERLMERTHVQREEREQGFHR